MRRIMLFVEDYGHQEFISAVLNRLAQENDVPIKVIPRSVRGGHGKVITECEQFIRDLKKGKEGLPDLLIVVTDANCRGYLQRKNEISNVIDDAYKSFTLYAIPDPHIERWLLLDSAAFKSIMGKGCKAPDQKCSRNRYKQLLFEAMQEAGIIPPLGGLEYAEDIVKAMDLQRMERADDSLGKFLKEIQQRFKEWSNL